MSCSVSHVQDDHGHNVRLSIPGRNPGVSFCNSLSAWSIVLNEVGIVGGVIVARNISRLSHKLMKSLDLPSEIVLDLPKITMIGNRELLIENHKGIAKYTSEEVALRVKNGSLRIYGRKLTIRFLEKDDMQLEGFFHKIEMV